MARDDYIEIKTTCTRDCYDGCGITVLQNQDGSVYRVVGDRDHDLSRGSLCGKCALAYNGVWRDPEVRLTTPLKRTGPKGSGTFEPVSWDDAFADIAERLKGIVADRGADSILNTHYTGTCSKIAGGFPDRFFNKLGATEVEPDTVCNMAGHVGLSYVLGASALGFDPLTAKDANCILVWGANPSASAPHFHKHWLPEADAKVIVIDPIAHETAKAADMHLQLRPGTDAALAFGMAEIALRYGFIDFGFIDEAVVGWDDVHEDIRQMPVERTAELTGLDPDLIVEAAMAYARGPSLMWIGQGMQRQKMGGNAFRACAMLAAVTGNMCKPGAGLSFLNGAGARGVDTGFIAGAHLAANPRPAISHMDLADTLADKARASAIVCWNNNIMASSPEQNRLREGLSREDLFTVCVELFHTDTTTYADYVLPAASFLEADDVMFPYFNFTVGPVAQAMAPPGEARPNQDIFRGLAHAMGYDDPEFAETDREIIDRILEQLPEPMSFEDLKATGTVRTHVEAQIQFAEKRFPTPSGKIEIASDRAEADGHPRVPLPHADIGAGTGRYRVLSPATKWTMNSSYANDPRIRAKMEGPVCFINPRDAGAENIADGARVRLSNDQGALELSATITTDVTPGSLLVYKGVWPMFDDVSHANVNVLNPGDKTDMGESCCVHGVEAALEVLG